MTNKEAKQKAIEEAWGDLWEIVKNDVNEDGYFHGDDDILEKDFFHESFTLDINTNKWANRPKSLKELETNNGWTRIEPDGSNLPDEVIKLVLINTFGQNEIITFTNDRQCLMYYSTRYTHFKVHKKELKPIY